ncbi:MAG: peptidase U32, partial [Desulfobulbus propionicus]
PALPLHASTLLTLHNSLGADFLTDLGFDRVVLARELSLDEIQTISKKSNAELEIFIHGAMCFSYSGLCLFSSMHGGKSSLRGECVQPCRRLYRLQSGQGRGGKKTDQGQFLFSMNDLCGISFLSRLEHMGVASLKIEGRLKSAEYVRNTVRAYRLCLDNLQGTPEEQKKVQQEAEQLLNQAMGRTRTSGFFTQNHGDVIRPHLLGVAGVFAGKGRILKSGTKDRQPQNRLSVQLRCSVQVGDRLRFQDESNDIRESFTLQHLRSKKGMIQHAAKGQIVTIDCPFFQKKRRKSSGGLLFKVDSSTSRKKEKGAGISMNKSDKVVLQPDTRVVAQALRNIG